ncbi:UNVERIFIED_CONTAM: hypothetical protein PYX00_008394 [Menopon gallinae]|uniref:TOM1-like protein 2 n=1 Tax=Menopon gallinae TaxID=328185 RepID=A0AAW2HMS6_9NEOP
MATFFGGNPFSSPVGQKIEKATDASLPSENWSLNMEICDIINETEDGPKDAMKAIRKRLGQCASRNYTVVMYTLIVLETCVKNCGKRFHVLVCNKEFITELVKMIGPKNEPPTAVQEKILNLVQSWADAFRNEPELSGVVQVYNDLKQKGLEFPMTDLDAMAPIHTPQRTLPEVGVPAPCDTVGTNLTVSLNPDQICKLTSEVQVVQRNMTVLSEMLNELVPGKEEPDEWELMKELYSTCQAMQERVVELISQISDDDIRADLLGVNDGLNNLFLRYTRYEKSRLHSSKEQKNGEAALIDLSDSGSGLDQQLGALSLKATPSELKSMSSLAGAIKDDEFDMFDQSRNATYESSKIGSSTYEANKEGGNLPGNLAAAATSQPKGQISHEESLTSSEFEKFLAERVAAAEMLPSTTENASSRGRIKKEEDPISPERRDSTCPKSGNLMLNDSTQEVEELQEVKKNPEHGTKGNT